MSGALTLLTLVAAASLRPDAEVTLSAPEIRIGDVVDLASLRQPIGGQIAGRVIARMPERTSAVSLHRRGLAALVRRAVPALQVPAEGEGTITFRFARSSVARNEVCAETSEAVNSGAPIWSEQTRAISCDRERTAADLSFRPRSGEAVAAQNLAAGTYLGRIRLPSRPEISPADRLTVKSAVGPVVIQREVTALQAGRADRRLFVMTGDGEVFAAPAASTTEGSR